MAKDETYRATYHAGSLNDIAEEFERNAQDERARAEHATKKKERNAHLIEANTWTRAAQIIRQTTITDQAQPKPKPEMSP